jgi:glyoxylase-like metal-dependent hydrolase (beta-lactamase superfamily II)
MAEGKLTVGNVEVIAIDDGEADYPLPLTEIFPGTTEAAWAPHHERYPGVFGGPNTWHAHWGGYLLRSQGHNLLVNTGVGSAESNPGVVNYINAGVDGRLLQELQSVGVRPEEVDLVFFTHLHPDHVGYNLSQRSPSPKATFSNARYVVHQDDWAAFKSKELQDSIPFSFWDETLGPSESLGVLDFLDGEKALTSEITAIPTPGHTPGHMSLLINSGGQRALVLGDIAVHPAQITESDWSFLFELDQPLANRTRQEWFDRLASEGTTVAACHFPDPGFGRIVRIDGRRYWQGFSTHDPN